MSNSEKTRLRWYEPDCFRSDRGAYWTFGKARIHLENQRPYVSPLVPIVEGPTHTQPGTIGSVRARLAASTHTPTRSWRHRAARRSPGGGSQRVLLELLLCHRLQSSQASWRPTRFEDEFTVLRYACSVCDIIPSTTVVLPSSHVLFELCVTGCVVQDSGSICPLDTEPFCEDECQKLKPPVKTKHNLKAHC
ncbi:hypothetical protein HPB52_009035 [Rhipicephalus sanguineus]|uniref:Uncharacterized protein n=1 Tax=Rhipicephalus sanguineus TaxID=34632 RepID=A0A9D4QA09_RHISA|nr:hypothetical protein HPB52_009035 [Rhipicephalus sanguineus]